MCDYDRAVSGVRLFILNPCPIQEGVPWECFNSCSFLQSHSCLTSLLSICLWLGKSPVWILTFNLLMTWKGRWFVIYFFKLKMFEFKLPETVCRDRKRKRELFPSIIQREQLSKIELLKSMFQFPEPDTMYSLLTYFLR